MNTFRRRGGRRIKRKKYATFNDLRYSIFCSKNNEGISCRWFYVLIADHKFEVQFFLISVNLYLHLNREKIVIKKKE
jgi:hypothetical protein